VYPALHVQFQIDVEPLGDALVDTHAVHAIEPVAEYVFSGHSSHADSPDTALYRPAAHAVQAPPSAPMNPGGQVQFKSLTLAGAEVEYVGHAVHGEVLVVFLYLPTAHCAHGPFTAPVYPTLHSHNVAPIFDSLDGTHATHAVNPTLPEYVFAAHSEQFDEPEIGLYSPAAHAVQASPSDPLNPGMHEQFRSITLASADDEFDGHSVHGDVLVVFLYLPTAH